MEIKDFETFPAAFCPKCQKKVLVSIETFVQEAVGIKVDIVYCPICDTVLNWDEDFEIEWITEQAAELLGWYRAPELENSNLKISS